MTTRFADHFYEGPHATRQLPADVPVGSLFSCTDHALIYKNDGAAWVTWATLGTTESDIKHPFVLLEADQTAADVPVGTPIGALVAQKA